jgi:TolB protein
MMMRRSGGFSARRGVAVAAAAVAATAAVGLAAPALAAAGTAARAPAAPSGFLGQGQVGSRAAVPWNRVGPGWSLALYSASQGGEGVKPTAGSSTLYLVNPSGGRYRMFSWRANSVQAKWSLEAWSGDRRRAMFVPDNELYGSVRQKVFQLQLRTGALTSFTLPAHVSAVGYSRPDGLNILAERAASIAPAATGTLMRFSLTGHLVRKLASVRGLGQVAYQPAGASIAAGSQHGITLVSNAGGVIRNLPVPGAANGCGAIRWWNAGTILASCSVAGQPGPRVWLVPASGAKPTALTPARSGSGFDAGDFNAWQLSSGLYVDGLGACGTLVIGRQLANGPEQQVTVPGAASSLIVNATRTQLQVERINSCSPGVSLVWFNPATGAMTVAIPAAQHQDGVVGVVPYFIAGKF